MKPYNMDKIEARFQLEIGELRITYSYGPKFWKDVLWSDENENRRVGIVFEDLDENRHDKSFNAPWTPLNYRTIENYQRQNNVYLVT
jgi:type VI secretion system protein ImpL